ncbi:MAG TPA: gamma-glutamyl-gamma-aminobutyrate hydrolase family protein [Planctomycetota bacterium]|nr:gamma-glutamyl-gamma-aminobutyrate hydrolase family protein [Planctomycetota bacterium]
MKKKPIIGINCKIISDTGDSYYKLDRNYVRSVERAGGLPILMPALQSPAEIRAFLDRVDGFLFTGGPDINPCRWKEKPHPKTDLMHEDRETCDFLALREVLKRDLPSLCICCGHQELNVVLGGSLHQHVYDLPGVKAHSEGATHPVAMGGVSMTRDIVGVPKPTVNSWHHQAIHKLGRGLVVTAESPDGLIEGVESLEHRFVIGVQWHPERMQDDARQQSLFRALVAEARK